MLRYFKHNSDALLCVLLSLWCVLGLFMAAGTEISGREAYMWSLSDSLKWGYIDMSTLGVFLCRLGRMFCGDSEIGVRLFSVMLQPVALYIFWLSIKTSKSTYMGALRYFLLCLSVPLLHISAFYSAQFSMLLLSVAVFVWAYKKFITSEAGQNNGYVASVGYMAVAVALGVYANPCALVMLLGAVISNPKMLLSWRIYGVLVLAVAASLPYFYSVAAQGGGFVGGYRFDNLDALWKCLFVFFVLCNPFLSFSLFRILCSGNPGKVRSLFVRMVRVVGLMLFAIFVMVMFGVEVSYSMVYLGVFPLLFFMYRRGERSKAVADSQFKVCGVVAFLLVGANILLLNTNRSFNADYNFVNKQIGLNRVAAMLEEDSEHKAELLITSDRRATSSLMNFYTSLPVYSQKSIYSDIPFSPYADPTERFYGKVVAEEVSKRALSHVAKDSVDIVYSSFRVAGLGTYYYCVEDSYIPSARVNATLQSFPEKIIAEQKLTLSLKLDNPYTFEIPFGGKDGFEVILHLQCVEGGRSEECYDIPLSLRSNKLVGGGSMNITTNVYMPKVKTGKFEAGITLQRYPAISSYNSKVYDLLIVSLK